MRQETRNIVGAASVGVGGILNQSKCRRADARRHRRWQRTTDAGCCQLDADARPPTLATHHRRSVTEIMFTNIVSDAGDAPATAVIVFTDGGDAPATVRR